jgi:PhnB protein
MTNLQYQPGSIDAGACVSNAWNLIKPNYWLYFGITALMVVAAFILSCIPFLPILLQVFVMTPLTVGIFAVLFREMRGEPVDVSGAELTLRGTTLMLGPEMLEMGSRSAKTIGASPVTLYVLTEDVDKVVAKAIKLGATAKGPVMDMFWGDRCGSVVDPDGYAWMVGTHKAEPTAKEMKKGMEEMMKQQPAGAVAAD